MSFTPHKSDTGAVPPHEYIPAAAGKYEAGQLLTTSGGMVAAIAASSSAFPPYLCMSDREIEEAGDLLAVTRVNRNIIYETTLVAPAASAAPGARLQIAAGGLQALAGNGSFELVNVDGTAAGDIVRGRFV